jgi:folate-dependent phosphoribosylglycinamide formyltransferase PurN
VLDFAITTHFSPVSGYVIRALMKKDWRPRYLLIQRPGRKDPRGWRERITTFLAPPGYGSLGEYLDFRRTRRELAGTPWQPACEFYTAFPDRLRALRLSEVSADTRVCFVENLNRDEESQRLLSEVDLLLVMGGQILKSVVFDRPRLGTFNLHNTLLPMFRGAGPIERILRVYRFGHLNGITLHRVDGGMDTGAIVDQAAVPLEEGESETVAHLRTLQAGIELVHRLLDLASRGQAPVLKPQDDSRACYIKQVRIP